MVAYGPSPLAIDSTNSAAERILENALSTKRDFGQARD
jgi:hypothetical protein